MNFLVDANVLSEATRPVADPRVLAWLDQHQTDLLISAVSRDGQKLFYASDRKMMVVESMSEETFRPAKPRELFECEFVNEFDVSTDGKEFLRLQPDVSAAVNRFNPNSELEKGSLWSKGCGHGD